MKSEMKNKWIATAAVAASMAFSTVAFAGSSGDPWASYSNNGGTSVSSSSSSSCTIRRGGTGNPIIIWGNGTGASPSTYISGLSHWASHGFVVSAANTSNAGTGTAMLACISAGANVGGDASRVGASGHSQGGGGSIMTGRDSRVDTTAPMQPYTLGLGHNSTVWDEQRGPMLLLTGGSDSIASPSSNAAPVFRAANVPVFWAELSGASHFEPTGDFGGYAGISTAWFRYMLKSDTAARNVFISNGCTPSATSSCTRGSWRVRQNRAIP